MKEVVKNKMLAETKHEISVKIVMLPIDDLCVSLQQIEYSS
jgi:hypothetical protein